jgi:Flp pilus assembly protein TadG
MMGRRRFASDSSGTTAIEFAILAPMFVALMFTTFEVGWLVTKSTLLDRALDIAIRDIRVGDAAAAKSQKALISAICDNLYVVTDCASSLTVEMTRIMTKNDFPATDATCVDRDAGLSPIVSFTPGSRAEIMFVRACLVSDALTPYIGIAFHFVKDSKNGYSIVASSAFMNEPGD